MKRLLLIVMASGLAMLSIAQNINKAEYFFDHDPGQGSGTPIPISTPGDVVNFPANISLAGITTGFHTLAIRVCDVEGKWSRFDYRTLYILSEQESNVNSVVAAEYFIDTDPGAGSGTPTPVGSIGAVVTFTAAIPANLPSGFHWLGIRTKDSDGKWGLYQRQSFYLTAAPVDMTAVTSAEYFFDSDPGVGNGTPLAFNTPAYVVAQSFQIPVPAGMTGTHLLAIRVKDQQGIWGLFVRDTFNVGGITINCPANVTVNATSGCTAVVNGLEPTVSPSGTNYNYTLTGATTGSGIGSASGHTFNAGVTTVTYGIATAPGINCSFTVTVNAATPAVAINASQTTICAGTSVTFTPTPTNGGNTPTYVWKVNGNNVGTGATYQSSTLANNDVVTAVMTSSLACVNPTTATSNAITMIVSSAIAPSVTINASQTTICAGTTVTFTPTPTNGGASPTYVWKKNGNNVGTGSSYQSSTLSNNDVITAVMTSSSSCANPTTATSNAITITVSSAVVPSVTISASQTTICAGTTVTFTPTPVNGGSNPTYTWFKNGNVVGSGPTYQSSTLVWGDYVATAMTSSLACANPTVDTSSFIQVFVYNPVTPTANIVVNSTTFCQGATVHFFAQSFNGGPNPTYQWKRNGVNFGPNAQSFDDTTMNNNDSVTVTITTSHPCPNYTTATSAPVVFHVTSSVTPSVTLTASQTTICPGQQVTFTADTANGGSSPNIIWVKNHSQVALNTYSYQTSSLQNGDTVFAIFNSNVLCATISQVISNKIIVSVNPAVIPVVTINATQTSICNGTPVTFTATPTNGGSTPTYIWKKNGNNVGTGVTYQSSTLANNDVITAVMTSSLACANPTIDTSNAITMAVSSQVVPSAFITATSTDICAGTTVTFNATVTGGGANPNYQWKLNGNNVGTNSPTYQNASLQDGNTVSVLVTSSLACASPNTATSNTLTMHVQTGITPYVNITASAIDICEGEIVFFGATCNDPNPTYQWKLNGANVGSNDPTYANGTLAQNDTIKVVMTTSMGCATSQTVTSNAIFMDVSPYVNTSVTITASQSSICPGQQVTFHANATNGGDPDYEWTVNNTLVGTNSDSLQISTLQNGDVVKVTMNTSLGCAIPPQSIDTMSIVIDPNCNPTSNLPSLTTRSYPVKEGDAGLTTLDVIVTLDTIATQPVSVNYATSNASATAGQDYIAASGVLNIPVGSSSGTIQLKIIGDLINEPNEIFWLTFSNPVNVILPEDPRSRIMIIDDDKKNNHTVNIKENIPVEEQLLKIPTVARRNQVWMIPQIDKFENEISIMSVQGQVVSKFVNYKNQQALNSVAAGLYFYQVRIKQNNGQYKFYTGRLLITE